MELTPEIEIDLTSYLKGEKSLLEVRRQYNLSHYWAQRLINKITKFRPVTFNWLYNQRMAEAERKRLMNFTPKQISTQLF